MFSSDRKLTNELKFHSSQLARSVLLEAMDNPVVKNVTAKGNFDEYVSKPENRGDDFTEEESSVFDSLDTKPYKKDRAEVRFSSTEITNNRNKELVVIKKSGRYVAFFSVRKPTDVTPDTELSDVEPDKKEDGDDIIIKVSRPFVDGHSKQDTSLLYNLINTLTKEYQI